MTPFARLAVVLLTLGLGATGCVLRPRPLVRVAPAGHVHTHHCGHHHVKAVVVVR